MPQRSVMKKWATGISITAISLAVLYVALDRYTVRNGVARSTAEIKQVLEVADSIYGPVIDGDLLWRFPFPDEIHWRHVRRGSTVELTGRIEPTAAHDFLQFLDRPELSKATFPTESGYYELLVDEASIRGFTDLTSGSFRIDIWPATPRD